MERKITTTTTPEGKQLEVIEAMTAGERNRLRAVFLSKMKINPVVIFIINLLVLCPNKILFICHFCVV